MRSAEKTYLLGQSVGLDEAAEFLLATATILFRDRKRDTEAILLRNLATELQNKADARYEHPIT